MAFAGQNKVVNAPRGVDAPEPPAWNEGWWRFVRGVVQDFLDDDVMSLAAAVAFYTAVSFAPIVLLLVTVGGFLGDATRNDLIRILQGELGPRAADVTAAVVDSAKAESKEVVWYRWVFGIVMLVVTASGIFAQLQASLNRVWNVVSKPGKGGLSGAWAWLRKRLLSMGMVLAVLFVLLVSLVLSTLVERLAPSGEGLAARAVVFVSSFLVASLLFAAMFKFLPDVKISWRDVWVGAMITAALFTLGKFLVSLYVSKTSAAESYGQAAGGLLALLLWAYYSCIILLLGAEITQQYARRRGRPIEPSEHAVVASSAPGKAEE